MSQAEWVMEKGLDTGLHINPNGTFSMSFPARKGFDSGRIWYDDCREKFWREPFFALTLKFPSEI